MRAPNESLHEFKAAAPKPAEPPAERPVRLSGKIAILKPVDVRLNLVRQRLPWFHRSIAVGGAFAVLLFVLGTLVDIAINGSRVEPAVASNDVATDLQSKRLRTPPKAPSPFPRFRVTNSLPVSDVPVTVRAVERRRSARSRVLQVAYYSRRRTFRPRLVRSDFIPTKMVIYAENGAIKTRIEPQLTAAYKKPATIPN